MAIAKAVDDAAPVRFVQIGTAGGEETISLAAAALRSSAIELMGSGLKSVPMWKLLEWQSTASLRPQRRRSSSLR